MTDKRRVVAMALAVSCFGFAAIAGAEIFSCDFGTNVNSAPVMADLDAVSAGGTWSEYGFEGDGARDLLSDGSNPPDVALEWDYADTGDWLQIDLDNNADFSVSPLTLSYDMAYVKAGANRFIGVSGMDSNSDQVFYLEWKNRGGSAYVEVGRATNTVVRITEDYAKHTSANTYVPSELGNFSITLDGDDMSFTAGTTSSNFTSAISQHDLSSIRFTIVGTNDPEAFQLDNVELIPEPISFGLLGIGIFGLLYFLRRRLNG